MRVIKDTIALVHKKMVYKPFVSFLSVGFELPIEIEYSVNKHYNK